MARLRWREMKEQQVSVGGRAAPATGACGGPGQGPRGSQTRAASSSTSSPPQRHTLSLCPHARDDGGWATHAAGRPEWEARAHRACAKEGVCELGQKHGAGGGGQQELWGSPWGTCL